MELTPEILAYLARVTPGHTAIYRLQGNTFITLYTSPSLPTLNGLTREEYTAKVKHNASDIVLPEDLPVLMAAVKKTLTTGEQVDCYYRVYHKKLGFDWAHVCARICGELEGDPVFLAVYNNASREKKQEELQNILAAAELQLQATRILNETSPIENRLNQILKMLGDFYQADRTYIFIEDNPQALTMSNIYEWCREGVTPQKDILQKQDIHYIDGWRPSFDKQQNEVVEDIETIRLNRPAEYALLKKQDIHSIIESPLITNGHLTGFIGADNPAPEKMQNSSKLLLTFGYSIANAMLKEENEKARQEHARELEELIRNIPGGMAILHETDGDIILDYANNSYFQLHYSEPNPQHTYSNCNILDKVYPADRTALLEEYHRIERVLEHKGTFKSAAAAPKNFSTAETEGTANEAGSSPSTANAVSARQGNITYRVPDDRGKLHWINAQFRPAYVRGGIKYFYVSCTDLDQQKQAEERIRRERVRLISLEGTTIETFTFNITTNSQTDLKTIDTGMMQLPLAPELLEQAETLAPAIGNPNALSRQIMLHAANRIPDARGRAIFLNACSGQSMRQAIKSGNIKSVIRYRRYVGNVIRWVSTNIEILPDPSSGDQIAFFYTSDITEDVIHEKLIRQIIELHYVSLSWYDVQTGTLSSHTSRSTQTYAYRNVPYKEVMENTARRFVMPQDQEQFLHKVSLENLTSQLSFKPSYSFYYARKERSSLPGNPWKRMRYDIFYLDEHQDIIIFLRNDVTEIFEQERETREKMAAAMHAAEAASQAKSDFLSRISHDIRTPINAITGMTAFALEDLGDQDQLRSELSKISVSTRQLLSLINDVLDISKAESGKIELHPEPYAYAEYIKSIRNMFEPICAQKKQNFILKGAPVGEGILVDRVRLDQITTNLLSNAVKYTPEGGTITYETDSKVLPDGLVDCGFTVRDNGIGMSKQFQQTMFEPFTQEHDNPERANWVSGTGLGLSIVKRLVDLMHGRITVESTPGQGTAITVRLKLPAATSSQLADRERQTAGESTLVKNRSRLNGSVLLVEDNLLNTEIATRLLRSFGLTVKAVANGQAALAAFSSSEKDYYQLILMDIQMPVLNGYETTKQLRVLPRTDAKTVPIIAMTADVFADAVQKCLQVGMNAHLAKPINPQELYKVVKHFLPSPKPSAVLKS
jgi:signal transduction histidine kinase/ActR/RegA family two-component response regulator